MKTNDNTFYEIGDRVKLLVDVPGLGSNGETGVIIGVHPDCGNSTYSVKMDKPNWRGEDRCNRCASNEVEKT